MIYSRLSPFVKAWKLTPGRSESTDHRGLARKGMMTRLVAKVKLSKTTWALQGLRAFMLG